MRGGALVALLLLSCADDGSGDRRPRKIEPDAPDASTDTTDTDAGPPSCGTFVSATAIGGLGFDNAVDLVVAPDGGAYVLLVFSGPLKLDAGGPAEVAHTPAGQYDTLIVKLDANGALEWSRQLTSSGLAGGTTLALTSDGFVVAGRFMDEITFLPGGADPRTLVAIDDINGFVARYDHAGELLWARQDSSLEHIYPLDVVVLPGDDVVVVGMYNGPATFGPGEATETTLPGDDARDTAYLARYDADGGLVWAQAIDGATDAWVTDVALDANGALVAVGKVVGPESAVFAPGQPNETVVDPGKLSGWIGRWQTDGTFESLVVEENLEIRALDLASDGSMFVAGTLSDPAVLAEGQPTETKLTTTEWDLVVARYDAAGALMWATQSRSGDGSHVYPHDVAALPDGGVAVVGRFDGSVRLGEGGPNPVDLLTTEPGTDEGAFAARFDAKGGTVCAWSFGSWTEDDALVSLSARPDGTWITAGSFSGSYLFAPGLPTETQVDAIAGRDGIVATFVF